MKPSKDSSTAPTTSAPLETSPSIPPSVGPFETANPVNASGLLFTPESLNGTDELRRKLTEVAQSEINSAIELFISTDLIPFLQTLSPGDLNQLSQKYALEVRFSCGEASDGSNFYYKFTIALSSKSPRIGGGKPLLLIPFSVILKTLFPIPTPS